jgi:hypothetical protein
MVRRDETEMEELARAQRLRKHIVFVFTFFIILVYE